MNTYAIADLHGRYDLLVAAVDEVLADSIEPARFVCMGDFVDRGPDSDKIIDLFMNWPFDSLELVVLKGNHEAMMFQCCMGEARLSWWIGNGGGRTLMSYGYENGDPLRPFRKPLAQHLHWLNKLPLFFETEQQVFVHAGGLRRGVPVAEHDEEELTWHCFDRNWKWETEDSGTHVDANYDKHIVHGHEQWAKGPILLKGRTDLDTFAWSTGRLAIGLFNDTQPGPLKILEVRA